MGRWDQKGTLRIANHTSTRFGHDSYISEKKVRSVDYAAPTQIPDANRSYPRPSSHVFPGLKKPVEEKYVFQENKKALYKDIITARCRPSDLIEVLKKEKRYKVKQELGRNEMPQNEGFAYALGTRYKT